MNSMTEPDFLLLMKFKDKKKQLPHIDQIGFPFLIKSKQLLRVTEGKYSEE